MSDRRLWAKIDRGYLDNPKMLDLLDVSPTAPLMHLASVLYCAQHLTDGHLNPAVARRKVGGTREDEAALVKAGLWHEPGHDCERCPQPEEGRVYVHDYLDHNQTARQSEAVAAKRSRAARKRWDANSNANPMQSAMQSAYNLQCKTDAKPMQKPCKTDANAMQRREEKRRAEKSTSLAHPPGERAFDAFWDAYPRKVGKKVARTKFAAALKRAPAGQIIAGAQRLRDDPNLPEPNYIPHPSTWLNRDGWDDDPFPPRPADRNQQRIDGLNQMVRDHQLPEGDDPWEIRKLNAASPSSSSALPPGTTDAQSPTPSRSKHGLQVFDGSQVLNGRTGTRG